MSQDAATYYAYTIRDEANATHAAFPQYAGRWDGPEWKLYIVRKKIQTKMGTAFLRGEVVLAKEENIPGIGARIVAYSRTTKIETVLQMKDVTIYPGVSQ